MRLIMFLNTIFIILNYSTNCKALESKWTPASEDEPLPLSSSYRTQLKELADVVRNNENPQATLEHLAKGQGLEPQELKSMLERAEVGEGNSGASKSTLGGGGKVTGLLNIVGGAAGGSLAILRFAARRPIVIVLLLVSIFAATKLMAGSENTISVPGFHGLTLGKPSVAWRNAFLDSCDHPSGGVLGGGRAFVVERKKDVKTLDIDTGRTLVGEACVEAVQSRLFDSYLPRNLILTKPPIANIRKARKMRSLGGKGKEALLLSWGGTKGSKRGLWRSESFIVASETNDVDGNVTKSSVTYASASSNPWKGSFTVAIESSTIPKEKHKVIVSVACQEGQNAMDEEKAEALAEALAYSCKKTIGQVASAKAALRSQTSRLNDTIKSKDRLKKQKRGKQIKEMEEMGRQRRRRWQRGSGGGSWRPSGDRQRSPNNC